VDVVDGFGEVRNVAREVEPPYTRARMKWESAMIQIISLI
jgi:hypothetical protein